MQAFRRGLHYPSHLLIMAGWNEGKWWLKQTEEEGLNCTGKQRESIFEHALFVHNFDFYVPDEMQTTSGIVNNFRIGRKTHSCMHASTCRRGQSSKQRRLSKSEGPQNTRRFGFLRIATMQCGHWRML